jgi:hypothetical protein
MQSTPKPKFDQQTVDTAIQNLKAMPPAPRETKQLTIGQAIKEMTPTIALLIRRGYSRERVVELLREQGIECSPATFRSLYRAPKRRRGEASAEATGRTTPRAADSAPASAQPTVVPTQPKSPPAPPPGSVRNDARGATSAASPATAKAS